MQEISQSWRRLAEGAARSEQLEAALREEWTDRVREARDRFNAEADAAWQAEEDSRLRGHRAALVGGSSVSANGWSRLSATELFGQTR